MSSPSRSRLHDSPRRRSSLHNPRSTSPFGRKLENATSVDNKPRLETTGTREAMSDLKESSNLNSAVKSTAIEKKQGVSPLDNIDKGIEESSRADKATELEEREELDELDELIQRDCRTLKETTHLLLWRAVAEDLVEIPIADLERLAAGLPQGYEFHKVMQDLMELPSRGQDEHSNGV